MRRSRLTPPTALVTLPSALFGFPGGSTVAVLFVSHSSRDDAQATALEQWLKAKGFTDIFIDHQNIAGGDKWREALRAAANSCRVVVCLVTPNWLGSSECFSEFMAAWYMGR